MKNITKKSLFLIFLISLNANSKIYSNEDCDQKRFFDCPDNIKITDSANKSQESEDIDCPVSSLVLLRSVLPFRSQGANTARELVGWQWELDRPYSCQNYKAFYAAYEFQHSFKSERFSNSLFGGQKLKFAGSLISDRTSDELIADNFGLSRNFRGELTFCPEIKSHIIDLGFYYGLDCFCQGSYIRIHAPIVKTIWNLNAKENIMARGDEFFDPCYMDSQTINPTHTANNLKEALSGKFKFGDMQTDWCSGKFCFKKQEKSGLADIDLIFGYNWINSDCYHLGGFIQAVLPTGPKPKNEIVFEPILGNKRHFELGIGASAHAVIWARENQNLALFFLGNATHLFENSQKRLFDFTNNGTLSRYLLLKEYTRNNSRAEYNGNLINSNCFNFQNAKVKVNIKVDASIMLAYRSCNWGIDAGYNFFGKSEEEIILDNCDSQTKKFAIKGIEPVCCFQHQIASTLSGALTIPTAQPEGTIRTDNDFNPGDCPNFPEIGEPFTVSVLTNNSSQPESTAFQPNSIEGNAQTCTVCLDQKINDPIAISQLDASGITIINSKNPTRFTQIDGLRISSGAATSIITHKFFAHINHTWFDKHCFNPHIGIGAEVELERGNRNTISCKKTGFNQWGVWIKTGISF